MKISYNWLKEYISTELPAEEVSNILTDIGLEVEGLEKVESIRGGLKGVVIGKVIEVSPHPNADRLKLTKVDVGHADLLDIVCGAPNVAEGQKVLVALVGTSLYINDQELKIKKSKIRGELSEGMLCAEDELGLGNSHDGIMILDEKAKIGTEASDYFNLEEDHVFEIGLTPNRIDAASHYGVARDLTAFLKLQDDIELRKPTVGSFSIDSKELEIKVKVEDQKACPRYSALTFTNVKVGESPAWLKRRLETIGLKSINSVVDITNFVLHEMGQPLHAFDADKVIGGEVIVKTLKKGDKFITLDEEERELQGEELMICNQKEGMCIAGVFGGQKSGVTESTTSVFLESAYFDPVSIRKTAKLHGLNTDASFRYERGADPNITIFALKRAAHLLKEICGAKVSSDILDIYPEKIEDEIIELHYEQVDRLIGKNIHRSTIKDILQNLEIEILNDSKKSLRLRIPAYRVDVRREVDLIEEILRIYGLNNIPMPSQMRMSVVDTQNRLALKAEEKIANYLASNSFREILNNSLSNPELFEDRSTLVNMLNPLSKELESMRQSMLFGGLSAIAWNINRKRGNLRFFEFGKVYKRTKGGEFQEERQLAIWICGDRTEESWRQKSSESDFFDLKQIVLELMEALGLKRFKGKESNSNSSQFQYGMDFVKGSSLLATIGEVSSKALKKADIEEKVLFAEIHWDTVLNHLNTDHVSFKTVSKFPSVRRDLALLINKDHSFERINQLAKETEKKYLQEVNLFDVYEGKNLGVGKKSYGVSLVFQDKEKTLTDKQIDSIMDRLIKTFKEKLGADLR